MVSAEIIIFAVRETKPHEKCRLVTEKRYLCTVRGEIPGIKKAFSALSLKAKSGKFSRRTEAR